MAFSSLRVSIFTFSQKDTSHIALRPSIITSWVSLVAHTVTNLPAMQETQVQSLGREDPLEKKMATHASTLAWKILWTEEPGGLQSMGSQELDTI